VNTALIGVVAADAGAPVLRFPSGEHRAVDVTRVPRWPGLGAFGMAITWDDDTAPEVVLVGPDGRDVEVRGAVPVASLGGGDRAYPAFDVDELAADAMALGWLPDGEHFGQLTGFADTAELAALRFVPGEILFGEEAEAAHAAAGDEHVEHTGLYISPDWEPPVLLEVDRARARFDVLDARWDPRGSRWAGTSWFSCFGESMCSLCTGPRWSTSPWRAGRWCTSSSSTCPEARP
jgi:hypothetical protein